ncbi:MAG: hypothetical protein JWR44_3057 [Hymenobacter sp.]|jgi:putative oxidoreductase|nr:hypothetical protein [Hymenobacter sp.]
MTSSTRNIIAWILQGLLGLAFIGFGGYGLLHAAENTKNFVGMGLPGWFAYLIAAAELLGGIGLLIPRFVRPAALGLIIIMIGAVVLHATKIPGGLKGGIPAITFLVLLFVIQWLRRPTPQVVA